MFLNSQTYYPRVIVDSTMQRAENGCYIKPRAVKGKEQDWINMIVNYNMTWKTPCIEILAYVSLGYSP